MSTASTRINLGIPLDLAILVEKECDRRGIKVPQFIKEAIFEKIKRIENKEEENDINKLKEDVHEIKRVVMLMSELLSKK